MANTLIEVLLEHAQSNPNGLAYAFVSDDGADLARVTFAELARDARILAQSIAARFAPGSRVILLFEAGISFLEGFFACLMSGVIAVPVAPLVPRRPADLARLRNIIKDADADAILTSETIASSRLPEQFPNLTWLFGTRNFGGPGTVKLQTAKSRDIAFLQYTSGSMIEPKGVIIQHGQLLSNLKAIHHVFARAGAGPVVSWLPMYHDMGLIGTALYSVYQGVSCYLLSPFHFLQRPARWLELISRVRAVISGAPNFAYDLCTDRVSDDDLKALDLSSWKIAFNGSEPVRARTIRRFESRFAQSGLNAGTVIGCYGLAEATLVVTGVPSTRRIISADPDELALGRVKEFAAAGVELVSCGMPAPGQEIQIRHPETRQRIPPRTIGEIWFSGDSVAQGYWRRPAETKVVFESHPRPGTADKRYLRTGDLGFMLDDELFVTGRAKDLLIVNGRNVYPHEIEYLVQNVSGALRKGASATFPIQTERGERIGLIQEVGPRQSGDLRELANRARNAVFDGLGVPLSGLYLVPLRSVRRTTSGKIRRQATVSLLRNGELPVLYEYRDPTLLPAI